MTNAHRTLRVLVVEDDPIAIEIFWRDLPADRFEVITAVDGAEALEMLSNEHIDVLVSDIVMPRMDGLSLVNAVRSTPGLRHIPILMATAFAADPTRIACFKAGANAFITKPMRSSTLPSLIERLVINHEQHAGSHA